MENVVFLAEVHDGPEEPLRILCECDQNAQRRRRRDRMKRNERRLVEFDRHTFSNDMPQHVLPAEPDDAGNRNRGKEINRWIVDGVGQNRVFVRIHMATVDFRETLIRFALAIEELQHHHAADLLLQIGVDSGDGGANAAVRVAHLVAENFGRNHNQRQHPECNQRQLPVHAQHDGDDSQQHKEIFKNGNHARREHFIQSVHVRSDARYQTTHRIFVIESNVHALQVAENLAAQVEHDFLSGPLHEVSLQKFENKSQQQ